MILYSLDDTMPYNQNIQIIIWSKSCAPFEWLQSFFSFGEFAKFSVVTYGWMMMEPKNEKFLSTRWKDDNNIEKNYSPNDICVAMFPII